MSDLILHIGLPKCASTTLQNLVFKGEEGYLGTYEGLPMTNNYAKQFKGFSPVGPRQWSDLREAKRWIERMKANHSIDIQRFILSDEMLSNKNKFVNRPIIPFLKKISDTLWTDGQIKVIMVLRNYAERIASEYAQRATSNPLASQANFEDYITHLLRKKHTNEYNRWVAELYETFGQENVCILLMEEIGQIHFWEQLKGFCQLKQFQPTTMQNSRKNAKRKGKNTWTIQPYDPAVEAKTIALKLFGFAWPYHVLPKKRKYTLEFTKTKITTYYANKYKGVNKTRPKEIILTQDLRQRIQEHYSKSTIHLSSLLKKDMAALGY